MSTSGADGAGGVQVVAELQAFVVHDGINGAGLASGAIVDGQLPCDRRR